MSRTMTMILCLLTIGSLVSPVRAFAATTILLFGDSIVAGYGLTADASLAKRTEALLQENGHDVQVINGGVSGDTTAGGKARLKWALDQHQPDIVVIALGGNDVLRGVQPRTTRGNVDAMLQTAQAANVKTVLVAAKAPMNYGPVYAREFNAIYDELAKQHRVKLHPFFLEPVFGKGQYMQSDGIHPNAEGIRVIAKELADFLGKEFF